MIRSSRRRPRDDDIGVNVGTGVRAHLGRRPEEDARARAARGAERALPADRSSADRDHELARLRPVGSGFRAHVGGRFRWPPAASIASRLRKRRLAARPDARRPRVRAGRGRKRPPSHVARKLFPVPVDTHRRRRTGSSRSGPSPPKFNNGKSVLISSRTNEDPHEATPVLLAVSSDPRAGPGSCPGAAASSAGARGACRPAIARRGARAPGSAARSVAPTALDRADFEGRHPQRHGRRARDSC